jgi:D-alanyl-D-alanine dipeptidase
MVIHPPTVDFATFVIGDVPAQPEPFRLINRIPIRDNGERLVDLRETNPQLSFGNYCLPYVRESVAEALKIASHNTPDHLDLRIFTGLRTHKQQADMYWSNYEKAKKEHPNWPESVLRKMTNRFFAPPDAKAPPGHCTGAAVDVGLLVRATGEGLDVRSPLEGWEGAPTAVEGLSPDAAENRRLLCFIMHSTGLSNCRDEFWHWSYGDSAWAVRVGAATACYGLIEAPPHATRVSGGKIELVPYNAEWPGRFEELKAALWAKLGGFALEIEHVGGTSVPGLSAQPCLDLAIVVSETGMASVAESLGELGYVRLEDSETAFRPDTNQVPKSDPPRPWPEHRVGAYMVGSAELKDRLAFRNFLREHSAAVVEYGELKAKLAVRYPWDRVRYEQGKEAFNKGYQPS